MAEFELGSEDAFLAMAWEPRFPDATNRAYDHGISLMNLWWVFANDDRAEEGLPPTNMTPWGPYGPQLNPSTPRNAMQRDATDRVRAQV